MSISNGIEICGIEERCTNASERDEKIIRLFRKMRLPAMAETYECMVSEGILKDITAEDAILTLLEAQKERREDNSAKRRAKFGNLWFPEASLSNLTGANALVPQALLTEACRFNFAEHGQYLYIIGPCHSGTTYLACAIASCAYRQGKDCIYVKLSHFLNPALGESRENAICSDLSLMRKVKLLILDDWLNAEVDEKSVLMIKEVLDYRTNNVGTILVSHCDPKGWKDRLLGTKAMVTSLMENIGKPLEIRLKDLSAGTKEEA